MLPFGILISLHGSSGPFAVLMVDVRTEMSGSEIFNVTLLSDPIGMKACFEGANGSMTLEVKGDP